MPRTIDEGFRDFLTRLTPSDTESQAAKLHRLSIKQCLETNLDMTRFFRIGSFGNGTSISGHSDVDYLACIPAQVCTKHSPPTLIKLRKALKTRFSKTNVRISSPSVKAPFGLSRSHCHEVVPAFYEKKVSGFDVFGIPDGKIGWMRTCPEAHNAYVRQADKRLKGKLKPLIRFMKAWKYFCDVPIYSFYLELRLAKYAESEKYIDYPRDFARFLNLLYKGKLAQLQDPLGISGYIPASATKTKLMEALSKTSTALKRSIRANEFEDKGRTKMAFGIWSLLYGPKKFPRYYY